MSSELLYTSAPKGLRQGSRGFCTVISSSGMPSNLATKLESLSGYRQMFAPDSPEANQNPIAYSHMTVTVGGQLTSVLSRIAAYGTDYSGRTNKLAHHVVPDRSEQCAAGPAWALQQSGMMRTQWDGNCQTTASGPAIARGNLTADKCTLWEQAAGDAGWAGALAHAWSQRQSKPVWLVYRLEDQNRLLALLSEAIALLPEHERWKATFNTYATQLPPDVQCRVRCVVEGTQDARMAKARGTVINLGQANGPAPTNAWSEIARGNQRPAAPLQPTPTQPGIGPSGGVGNAPASPFPARPSSPNPSLPSGQSPANPTLPGVQNSPDTSTQAQPVEYAAEPPALRPPVSDDASSYSHTAEGVEIFESADTSTQLLNQHPKRSKAPMLAAIAAMLFVLIIGGVAATVALKPDLLASLSAETSDEPKNTSETTTDENKTDNKKNEKKNADTEDKVESTRNPAPKENPAPPDLPKLTIAILENDNKSVTKGKTVTTEGETLTVQVKRENKESGHGESITLSNDELDKRVSFNPAEITFTAEEDSKEIELTIAHDQEFNPAELTITAQFKKEDGKDSAAKTTLLVDDTNDLTIELMDGESKANELSEGTSYQIAWPNVPEGITREISYEITTKEGGTTPPGYNLKQEIATLKKEKEEHRLVLNRTEKYRFADDFCTLSLVVSYKKNDTVLGKKTIKRPVKDVTPVKREIRWLGADSTFAKSHEGRELRIAVYDDKEKQPKLAWTTNEWPVPDIEANCSELENETIKLSSVDAPSHSLKTKRKSGKDPIHVEVTFEKKTYEAHLFADEETAKKFSDNPNEIIGQANNPQDYAFVNTTKLIGIRKKNLGNIELEVFQIIIDENIKPFENPTTFKLRTDTQDKNQKDFVDKYDKYDDYSEQLNSFPISAGKPWSDNPVTCEYEGETRKPVSGLDVIYEGGKFAICYKLEVNPNKEGNIHTELNKLLGSKEALVKLTNHNAATIASQLEPDDRDKKMEIAKALNGFGKQVFKGSGKDKTGPFKGKIANDTVLATLRRNFFEKNLQIKNFDNVAWRDLKNLKQKFTWNEFARISKDDFPNIESFTRYEISNGQGESSEYKDNTERQLNAIKDKIGAIQQAIKQLEQTEPFDLKRTLIIEQANEEILRIPLKFTLKFE